MTAAIEQGRLIFSGLNTTPVAGDLTGSFIAALNPAPDALSVTASLADNRLILSKDDSQPIALRDVSGNLVESLGFETRSEELPPIGSRIAVAGQLHNFF